MKKISSLFIMLLLVIGATGCESPVEPKVVPPVLSISANPASIEYAGKSIITWSSSDGVVTATGGNSGWQGSKSSNGSWNTGTLMTTTTFTLTSSGPGGSVSESTTVVVGPAPVPVIEYFTVTPSGVAVVAGTQVKLAWATQKGNAEVVGVKKSYVSADTVTVVPTVTTVYTLVVTGIDGTTVTEKVTVVVTPLSVGSYYKGGLIFSLNPLKTVEKLSTSWESRKAWVVAKDTAAFLGGRLPTVQELLELYTQKRLFGLDKEGDSFFWSGEEAPDDNRFALSVLFNSPSKPENEGKIVHSFKEFVNPILVVRSF